MSRSPMRRPRKRALRRALGLALAAGLAAGATLACRDAEPLSPEAQVRQLLEGLEEAAEAGEVGRIKEHISARYEDAAGRDRRAVGALLAFHVLRHPNRHLLLRVREVSGRADGRVSVLLHVGLAGRGGAAAFSADVFEVELDFRREEDTWRVVWAAWNRAPAGALL